MKHKFAHCVTLFFPGVCNLHKHSIFFSASNWTLHSIFCASKRRMSASQDAMTHSGYISEYLVHKSLSAAGILEDDAQGCKIVRKNEQLTKKQGIKGNYEILRTIFQLRTFLLLQAAKGFIYFITLQIINCSKNISDTLSCASCATFLFLPHLTSSVIYC